METDVALRALAVGAGDELPGGGAPRAGGQISSSGPSTLGLPLAPPPGRGVGLQPLRIHMDHEGAAAAGSWAAMATRAGSVRARTGQERMAAAGLACRELQRRSPATRCLRARVAGRRRNRSRTDLYGGRSARLRQTRYPGDDERWRARRGADLGLTNVEHRILDADGVELRRRRHWGCMLIPIQQRPLTETRRVCAPRTARVLGLVECRPRPPGSPLASHRAVHTATCTLRSRASRNVRARRRRRCSATGRRERRVGRRAAEGHAVHNNYKTRGRVRPPVKRDGHMYTRA